MHSLGAHVRRFVSRRIGCIVLQDECNIHGGYLLSLETEEEANFAESKYSRLSYLDFAYLEKQLISK